MFFQAVANGFVRETGGVGELAMHGRAEAILEGAPLAVIVLINEGQGLLTEIAIRNGVRALRACFQVRHGESCHARALPINNRSDIC